MSLGKYESLPRAMQEKNKMCLWVITRQAAAWKLVIKQSYGITIYFFLSV